MFKCSYLFLTSSGEISSTSTPKARAIAACLNISSFLSSVKATVIDPQRLKPVETPVSFSKFPYNSCEYLANFVMFADARNCAINPAACHVVPDVSCLRSKRIISFQPFLAK